MKFMKIKILKESFTKLNFIKIILKLLYLIKKWNFIKVIFNILDLLKKTEHL